MGKVDALCRANSSNRILKSKEEKPEWLDADGIASLLCLSYSAVNKMDRLKELPSCSFVCTKERGLKRAWRKADIIEWDAIGRPSGEEFRDKQELAKRKAMAFFEAMPLKAVDSVVSKYR